MNIRCCMCALLTVAVSLLTIDLVYAEPQVGYVFRGEETYDAGEGARVSLFTIDAPGVGWLEGMYEYILVVLSYDLEYYCVYGYCKLAYPSAYEIKYFTGLKDLYRYNAFLDIYPGSGPSPGTSHIYYILHPYGYGEGSNPQYYKWMLDGAFMRWDQIWGGHYTPVDQQASIKTSSASIRIDGSHFVGLKRFVEGIHGWTWALWDSHLPYEEDPYDITEVSDSEFYASGGG